MSLEGNLRDLQLQEVFQLLAHGRKSGQLRIVARLAGLAAVVSFEHGAIVDALVAAPPIAYAQMAQNPRTRQQVEGAALELLTWRDGVFKFVPAGERGAIIQRCATLHRNVTCRGRATHRCVGSAR